MEQSGTTEELLSGAAVIARHFCCSTELGGDELQASEDERWRITRKRAHRAVMRS
jgi:hypothetical protein